MFVDVFLSLRERNISQTALLSFFFQFYFLNVLQSYNNINKVYVPGHKFYIFTVICVCQRYHPRLGLRQSETFPHLSNVFIIDDGSCAH